jgi:hypothetical protein
MADLTDLQQAILHTKREHPGWSASKVADHVGSSESYTRKVLSEYDTAQLRHVEGEPATATDIESTEDTTETTNASSGGGFLKVMLIMLLLVLLAAAVRRGFPSLV